MVRDFKIKNIKFINKCSEYMYSSTNTPDTDPFGGIYNALNRTVYNWVSNVRCN